MSDPKSYFFQSFMILLLSACMFVGLREVLPKKLFSASSPTGKNMLIDSMLLDVLQEEEIATEQKPAPVASAPAPKVVFPETHGLRFPAEEYENYHGHQYLISFFEKLFDHESTGHGNIRIR